MIDLRKCGAGERTCRTKRSLSSGGKRLGSTPVCDGHLGDLLSPGNCDASDQDQSKERSTQVCSAIKGLCGSATHPCADPRLQRCAVREPSSGRGVRVSCPLPCRVCGCLTGRGDLDRSRCCWWCWEVVHAENVYRMSRVAAACLPRQRQDQEKADLDSNEGPTSGNGGPSTIKELLRSPDGCNANARA